MKTVKQIKKRALNGVLNPCEFGDKVRHPFFGVGYVTSYYEQEYPFLFKFTVNFGKYKHNRIPKLVSPSTLLHAIDKFIISRDRNETKVFPETGGWKYRYSNAVKFNINNRL